jgi:hypothetical protein
MVPRDDGSISPVTFISRNGKGGERFDSDVTPVAISDGASHIYYVRRDSDGSSTLRVRRGTNGASNLLSRTSTSLVALNDNYSQAIANCDGRAFISIRGGERESFSDNTISQYSGFVVPQFTQAAGIRSGGVVYGFRDFRGKAFQTNDGVFMISRSLTSERLTSSDARSVQMSADGSNLFYLRGGALRSTSATNPHSDGFRIARDVRSFVVTPNGRHVYFVDTDRELNRSAISVDAPTSRVAEPVEASSLQISGRGTVFFMEYGDRENVLYFTNNTTRQRVTDDVDDYVVTNNNAFYTIDAGGGYFDLHRSNGNGRFRVIARNVRG